LKKIHNKLKSSVIVKLNTHDHSWTLYQELKAIINNKYIVVPKGFTTDFASVPKVLKGLIPFEFLYNQIVVIHDYLYSTKIVSRKEADLILKEGLLLLDNYSVKAKIYSSIFYSAVRLFGGSHWNN